MFQPEPNLLRGLRFAKELQRFGHQVQVTTGFPNYPGGKLYPGYRTRLWQREMLDGVEVIRVPAYLSHDQSAIRRVLSYLSLALSMAVLGPFLVAKADVVTVFLGPMTLCLPALVLKYLRRMPIVLDVQDLWPESVTGSGMLRGKCVENILSYWCSWCYRRAKHIIALSDGYKALLVERGARPEQVSVLYNWCDPSQEQVATSEVAGDSFHLQGSFNVVYAGNLGELQALDTVILAAKQLQATSPSVRFVFVGKGTQEAHLKQLAAQLGASNVTFIARLPVGQLPQVFRFAAVLLVHLKNSPLSSVGIPQKTQAYLASGIPILCAVEGDTARLVERSAGGVTCRAESPEALANAVTALVSLPQEELKAMGRRGREFYLQHLSFATGVERIAGIIEAAGGVSPEQREAATYGRSLAQLKRG